MAYLLHIDTSTENGVIALGCNGTLLSSRTNIESRNHAASINLMIAEVLAEACISMSDLDGVVVCAGPGSYTGLRIGMATAKGLCYSLDKPFFLDNKLELLANDAITIKTISDDVFVALLKAREKEYFTAVYDADHKCIVAPVHVLASDVVNALNSQFNLCIISDEDEAIIHELFGKDVNIIKNVNLNIENWIKFSFRSFECNNSVTLSSAEPFYLKQVYTHK